MKNVGETRGENKGRKYRGRGVSHNNNLESTEFDVSVNGEDGGRTSKTSTSSRVKPPPTASRKIVLSKKGESSGLENVTVKSLEEIKRAKEMRKKDTTASADSSSVSAKYSVAHNSASQVEPTPPSSATSSMLLKTAPSKLSSMVKPLTIQLKALPMTKTVTAMNNHPKSETAEVRPTLTREPSFNCSLEGWSEPDCEPLDDEEFEEELIWEDDESMEDLKCAEEPGNEVKNPIDHAEQDEWELEKQGAVDYSDVPLGSSHNDEDFMEMISLHPDDSLFDDDDDNELDNIGRGKEQSRSCGPKGSCDDSDLRALIRSGQNEKRIQSSQDTAASNVQNDDFTSDQHAQRGVASMKEENKQRHRSDHHSKSGLLAPNKEEKNWKHKASSRVEKQGTRRITDNQRKVPVLPHRPGPRVGRMRGGQHGRGHPRKNTSKPHNDGPGLLPEPVHPTVLQANALSNFVGMIAGRLPFGPFLNGSLQMNRGTYDEEHMDFIPPEPPHHHREPHWRGGPRIEREGPRIEREGPRIERGGHRIERGGPRIEREGPRIEREGPRIERGAPRIEREMIDRRRGGRLPPLGSQHTGRQHGTRGGNHLQSGIIEHGERAPRQPRADRNQSQFGVTSGEKEAVVKPEKLGAPEPCPTAAGETSRHHPSQEAITNVIPPEPAVAIQPAYAQVKHLTMPEQKLQSLCDPDLIYTMPPSQSTSSSPFHNSESEHLRAGSKRKSPSHSEPDHGSKVQKEASPTGEPGVLFAQPLGYCWLQLNKGQCNKTFCKYIHLSTQDLQEFQKTGNVMATEKSPKSKAAELLQPGREEPVAKQMPGNVDEKTLQEMTEVMIGHLDDKNLGAAWQVIERMDRMHHTPGLPILERLLLLCSDASEPAIAGQVACKVFDMIGRVRVKYNRHDYTTLIKCLCHCGQYIRAYEMLGVMRSVNCVPTHDVFVDLVQASHADPEWAFGLLDEIQRTGLFKTSICSSLLILGCESGPNFLDRTWALFQELVRCQVHPSKEAFKSLLQLVSDLGHWDKVIFVLKSFPSADVLPPEVLSSIMNHACHNTELIEDVVTLLLSISAKNDPGVDHKAWNSLLTACCTNKGTEAATSQSLYSLMEKLKVPLSTQSYDAFMKTLIGAHLLHSANLLFLAMTIDPVVAQDPPSVSSGLLLLVEALRKNGDSENLLKVVHFMLDKKLQPPDNVMLPAVVKLNKQKNYIGIHVFFKQCQATGITPPLDVCRQIVASLEMWKENPTASLDAYAALRRAYPVLPSGEDHDINEVAGKTESSTNKPPTCRYYNTLGGCHFGRDCKFLHPQNSATGDSSTGTHAGVNLSEESKNPFVLRKHGELSDTTQTAVESQLCPPSTSSIAYTKPPHIVPRSGPFVVQNMVQIPTGQSSSFKLNDTVKSHHIATGSDSQWGRQVPQQSAAVAKATIAKDPIGGPVLELHPTVPTISPFQLRPSAVPGQHPPSVRPIQLFPRTPAVVQHPVRNPFTVVHPTIQRPTFWRTNSVDSQKAMNSDARGILETHSAPATCDGLGSFNFPSKEKIEFYLPRIKYAGQEQNWTEMAKIYSDIKGAGVEMDDRLFQPFVSAFTSNSPDDIGDSFDCFLKELQLCLKRMAPENQPQQSSNAGFDADDQFLVGRFGVALINLCLRTQRCREGYSVLYSLHECGINYSQCGGAVGLQQETMSETAIALMAVEVCLGVEPMQCDGALEVLRASNYAHPTNSTFLPEEAERRRKVFQTLHGHFLDEAKFDSAYELLQKIGSADVGPQKSLYNDFVRMLVKAGQLDRALKVLEEMEANFISRDPESIRALVTGLGSDGKTQHAKKLFLAGCLSGVYPPSVFEENPWTVIVRTSFSALEVQFYLEKHLVRLQEFTESKAALYEEEKLQPLTVVIMSDEAPRLYSGYMANEEIVRCVRNMVLTVLGNDFNPPFSCTTTDRDGEIIVNPRSLRRWFLANPITRRHRKGVRAMTAMLKSQSDVTYPYLQAGMSNPHELPQTPVEDLSVNTSSGNTGITVSLVSQSTGQSERIVMQEDEYERSAGVDSWHDLDKLSKKALRDKVAHAICGRLTFYLRQGKIANKEDFRHFARKLTQQFMDVEYDTMPQENYEELREKAYAFADRFFRDA